jgi:hypothetical protein
VNEIFVERAELYIIHIVDVDFVAALIGASASS